MAISDVYTYKSGSVANTVTTANPIISLYGTAAKRLWVVGVRVEVGVTAAAAGNSLLFQLARPNATNTGTGLAPATRMTSPPPPRSGSSRWPGRRRRPPG